MDRELAALLEKLKGALNYVILFVAVIIFIKLVVFVIRKYNSLQKLSQAVMKAHSNIVVSMKKRLSLVNELMEIAAGYGDHEKLAHINISQNTNIMPGAVDAVRSGNLGLSHITALAQNFPELKANQTYQHLMEQLEVIEGELQEKRETYNEIVMEYNTYRNNFPAVIVASALRFKPVPYFDVDNTEALENIKEFHSDDKALLNATFALAGYKAANRMPELAPKIEQAAIQHQNVIEQVYCKQCNTTVAAGSKFCSECGTLVT